VSNFDDLIENLHNEPGIVLFLWQLYSLVLVTVVIYFCYKSDAMLLIEGEFVDKDQIILLILHSVNLVDVIPHSWSSPRCYCLRVIGSKIVENSSYEEVSLLK